MKGPKQRTRNKQETLTDTRQRDTSAILKQNNLGYVEKHLA